MKSNEYIKRYGINQAKKAVSECTYGYGIDLIELKLLVESWELVEKVGGLSKAKADLASTDYNSEQDFYETLKQAIIDVESCNEF